MRRFVAALFLLGCAIGMPAQEFPVLCVPCELAKAREQPPPPDKDESPTVRMERVVNTMEIIQRKVRQSNNSIKAVEGIRDGVNDVALVSEAIGTIPVIGTSFALASIAIRRGNEYYADRAIDKQAKEMEFAIRSHVEELRKKSPVGGDVNKYVQTIGLARSAATAELRLDAQRELNVVKTIPRDIDSKLKEVTKEIQIEALARALESLAGATSVDKGKNDTAITRLQGNIDAYRQYHDNVTNAVTMSLGAMNRRISSLEDNASNMGQELMFLSFVAERQMDDRTRLEAHEKGLRELDEQELAEVKTRVLIEDVTKTMSTGVQMLSGLSQLSAQVGMSPAAQQHIAKVASLAQKAQAAFSIAISIKTMDPVMALNGLTTLLGSNSLAGPKDPLVYNAVMDLQQDIAEVSRKLDTVIELQKLIVKKLDTIRYEMDLNHRQTMRHFYVQGVKLDAALDLMTRWDLGEECTDCLILRTPDRSGRTQLTLDLYRSPVAHSSIKDRVKSGNFRARWSRCRESLYSNTSMDYESQYLDSNLFSRQVHLPSSTLSSAGGDTIEVQWSLLYELAKVIVPDSAKRRLNTSIVSCIKNFTDINTVAYSNYAVSETHPADAAFTIGLLFRPEPPFMLHSGRIAKFVKTMVAASPFLLMTREDVTPPSVDFEKHTLSEASYDEWKNMTSKALVMIDYTVAEHALVNGAHLMPFVFDSIVRYARSKKSAAGDTNFSALCRYMSMNPWIARNFATYVVWRALNESKNNVIQYYFVSNRGDSSLIKSFFSGLPIQNVRVQANQEVKFSFDGQTYWPLPNARNLVHPQFVYDPITLHLSETQASVHELRASVFIEGEEGYVTPEQFQSAVNVSASKIP